MHNPFLKKLFVFFATIFFAASPVFFVSAQSNSSDGSAPSATDTGVVPASAPVVAPVKTASPVAVLPRAVPTSTAVATSSPATVAPRGTPKPPPTVSVSTTPTPAPTSMPVPPPTIPPPVAPAPESPSSFPAVLIALAAALVLAPYGMVRMLSKNDTSQKNTDNRCDDIKQLLERKKSTLEIVSGTLSLKQLLIDAPVKKIEDKKEELKEEITTVVIDEVAGEEGGKIIESVKEAKETYEALVENLDQAKLALEYFTNRQKQLREDVGKIESAYQTCLLGNSVFEGASRLGSGLELFETGLHQKLYRYTSNEKDVFARDAILASNLAEMAEAVKWLPSPKLSEGGQAGILRFFLTEKGKEEYEKALLPLHKKYLSDISCEETDSSAINTVVYEDEWQVVAEDETKDSQRHT